MYMCVDVYYARYTELHLRRSVFTLRQAEL